VSRSAATSTREAMIRGYSRNRAEISIAAFVHTPASNELGGSGISRLTEGYGGAASSAARAGRAARVRIDRAAAAR
jgi:hypothetical protein